MSRREQTAAGVVPEALLRRVVELFDPQRVILFGSHARGEARPDSDIDLLVVMDDDAPEEAFSRARTAAAEAGHDGLVDIKLYRATNFAERSRVRGALPFTAAREGVWLYERFEASLVKAEVEEWLGFADADTRSARALLNLVPPLPVQAAFHAQQAAEKLLKAMLILQGRDAPRTHDLGALYDLVGDALESDSTRALLTDSSKWAVETRYPHPADRRPTATAVARTLELVERLRARVAAGIAALGTADRADG